jgi:hypothetical protein
LHITVVRVWVVLFLVLASVVGALSWGQAKDRDRLYQLLAAVAPVSVAVVAISLIGSVVHGALFYWNPPRLATAFGLTHGYHLYAGRDAGPVLNTLYAPMSTLAYMPVTFARTTFGATVIGAVIGGLFFFVPVAVTLFARRVGGSRLRSLHAFCFFTMLALSSQSLKGSAFFQPIDPIGFGFACAACAMLAAYVTNGAGTVRLTLSAAFAVLAVWSKQTMAPLILALPAFVLLSLGRKHLLRYVMHLALWGIGLSVLFVLAFGLRDMVFNMFVLPSHHPFRSDRYPFIYLVSMVRDCREWPIALLLLGTAIACSATRAREWLRAHPWTLFVWVAISMLPTSYLGFMKEGGRSNSMSAHTYFLAIAGALCLLGAPSFPLAESTRTDADAPLARWLWRVTLIVAGTAFAGFMLLGTSGEPLRTTLLWICLWLVLLLLAASLIVPAGRALALQSAGALTAVFLTFGFAAEVAPFSLGQLEIDRASWRGPVIGAFDFASHHRDEVYFPYDPLSTLLTDGKLYHFDYGLFDRRLAGFEVSEDVFRAHLPSHMRYVMYPRWVAAADTPRESVRRLPEFSSIVRLRGFEDWDVYMRPADVPDADQSAR